MFCPFCKDHLEQRQCIPRHEKDIALEDKLKDCLTINKQTGHILSRSCRCKCNIVPTDDYMGIYNWCHWHIDYPDDEQEPDFDEEDDARTFSNHNKEENAALEPVELQPNNMSFGKNQNGTLPAYYCGERISGERLGNAMVAQAAIKNGVNLGCTGCTCPVRACQHDHRYSADESPSAKEM